MKEKLVVCQTHPKNDGRYCHSCDFAIDWNVWRKYCHCGEPATGYRTMGLGIATEYFCDEHFQDIPAKREYMEGR